MRETATDRKRDSETGRMNEEARQNNPRAWTGRMAKGDKEAGLWKGIKSWRWIRDAVKDHFLGCLGILPLSAAASGASG